MAARIAGSPAYRTDVRTLQEPPALSIFAFVGLGVVVVTSVVLWRLGSRFARGYVALHGEMPRMTWMFHRADDPELERSRRLALAFLPLYLVGAFLYLATTGPLA